MARINRGRKKVENKKMTKESNLLVTFSKRRSGLFKKASELCTLTGAEIAVIVFSPGNRAFSFGHPSVEAVVERFISGRDEPWNHNNNPIHHGLNMQLIHLLDQQEVERKEGEKFTKMRNERAKYCWWEKPTDDLNLAEAQKVIKALSDLKKTVAEKIEKLRMEEQGPGGGPYSMGDGPSGGGQTRMAFPPQLVGGPYFMGVGPSGGGQAGMAFPPQPFPQPPPPEMNAAEWGLSLFSSMEDID